MDIINIVLCFLCMGLEQCYYLFRNVVKEIYLLDIKRVRGITSFLGNGLATVQFTVVCIALLVRVTLTDANIVKYSRQKNKAISFLPAYIVFIKTGDNNVVAKISSHRLPVNGLYAAKIPKQYCLPPVLLQIQKR